MVDPFFQTIEQLEPVLRAGDLEACEKTAVEKIRQLPRSPFDLSIEVDISNDPADAAKAFDHFFETEAKRIKIAAAYTEMNGFDINPRLWFCDFFAYTSYGGHGDYDWLSDWQSQNFPRYTIRGMEALQAVYASSAFGDKSFRDAAYMSSLLVVIKFQRFIKRTASEMKLLRFPLLVTAHDFDFIAEFTPRNANPSAARNPRSW
jgi:hypothetical protein